MSALTKIHRLSWLVPGLLLLAILLLLWLSPEEQTLGAGIKIVYLHVAITWTGMLGIALAGLLGLGVMWSSNGWMFAWMQVIGRVAFWFYSLSVVVGLASSKINWGGFAWREPRTMASLNIFVAVLVVMILDNWLAQRRLRGALFASLLAFMVWSLVGTPLVLHPDNPIRSSPYTIQTVFYGAFALVMLTATWAIWYLRKAEAVR